MKLNNAGEMIEKWYYELENKFPDIKCHEMIIMPNHFHCIIENVGADLRVCPNTHTNGNNNGQTKNDTNNDRQSNGISPTNEIPTGEQNGQSHRIAPTGEQPILGEHVGSPLHPVVQWFKTMSTNEYIRGVKNLDWPPFDEKLWQRNYYEHIIRTEQSYQTISNYITNNPAKWQEDKFYVA